MKPTPDDVMKAVAIMAKVIPFFPGDDLGKQIVASQIELFVNTDEELRWLMNTCIGKLEAWPSIPQLRALFCTQFKPADGQYPSFPCEIPGFRPEDFERQYFEREAEETQKRLEEYKAAKQLAPTEDREPFPLPEVKRIPELPKPAKPRICRHCKLSSHPETFINDYCPNCGQFSKPMNLRELEESLGIRPSAPDGEKPPETVQ